ncbi:MAG TPA: alanine racemase [Solirubrobacteraceae bacterium]|jgi:alanine racemase|nr:alanine racemase [Solirubrobacteraceae bacterium]
MSVGRTADEHGTAAPGTQAGSRGAREAADAGADAATDTRRALARVNVAAIERNVAHIRGQLGDGCGLCAVVKADGYGHGALQSAHAALGGGAMMLAVAGAREAVELRAAGFAGVPLLVMGALSAVELGEALRADAEVVLWSEAGVRAVAAAGGGRVHVKLDSGMGRLGTRDRDEARRVVELAAATPGVELAGAMTHFATADDRSDDGFFERQLDVFAQWAAALKAEHPTALVHAANSAATLREPSSHFDMVRCGIAIYGMDPFGADPLSVGLEPALELSSYVAEVKRCAPGESAGYGRRFVAERETQLGVVPIGYGDGWRRGLSDNADVLVAGRRRALVGTVSMDNLTVDLDADPAAHELRGAEAVLIGASGSERILAEEVARRLDTINYEVTCALTQRVPRLHHRDGSPTAGSAALW